MKNILKAIWEKKIAWFVLITGLITVFSKDYIVGSALVGVSISLFNEDDEEK